MTGIAVTLACWLLKRSLPLQQRTRLLGAILDGLNAVPLQNIIANEDGRLMLNGVPADLEKVAQLREGAKRALDNPTRKLIREQVASVAGTRGVVEGDTPEKLYFYRAALWWALTEEELYKQLSQM